MIHQQKQTFFLLKISSPCMWNYLFRLNPKRHKPKRYFLQYFIYQTLYTQTNRILRLSSPSFLFLQIFFLSPWENLQGIFLALIDQHILYHIFHLFFISPVALSHNRYNWNWSRSDELKMKIYFREKLFFFFSFSSNFKVEMTRRWVAGAKIFRGLIIIKRFLSSPFTRASWAKRSTVSPWNFFSLSRTSFEFQLNQKTIKRRKNILCDIHMLTTIARENHKRTDVFTGRIIFMQCRWNSVQNLEFSGTTLLCNSTPLANMNIYTLFAFIHCVIGLKITKGEKKSWIKFHSFRFAISFFLFTDDDVKKNFLCICSWISIKIKRKQMTRKIIFKNYFTSMKYCFIYHKFRY